MLFKNITIIDENYQAQTNMYVLVKGEKITYIGKETPKDYSFEVYDGENKVLVPGFFNLHCHIPMGLMRGYGEGLPLDRWLHEKIFPFEALMPAEDMYWGSLLGISELLASGAVSFTDMYMKMDAIVKAVSESGIKANLSDGLTSFNPAEGFAENSSYKSLNYLMDYQRSATHDRIIGDASLHGEYTSHEKVVREVAEYAKANELRMHLHLSETKKEHEECKARHNGMTPAQWFNHCNVFDVPTTAAHCVHIEGADFDILASKGVTVCNNPSSNLKLGSGIAPVKAMFEKGISVAVGTDGASSNNNLNMLEEINLAAILQKGVNNDPDFLKTDEVLRMATINGAKAQGRANCGAIKVGNRADLVVYDFDKAHLTPVHDVAANLLYSAQASDVVLTMVDGKILYKNGEYLTIDIEKVKYNSNRICKEKLEQLK